MLATTDTCDEIRRLEKRLKSATGDYIQQEKRLEMMGAQPRSPELRQQRRKMDALKQAWRAADGALEQHRKRHGCSPSD